MAVDLGLSPDQQAIEDVFASFFSREAPPTVARAAEPLGFDRALWDKLGALEAPGMAASTEAGGGGATLSELVVVAETVGRSIAPVPLVEHLVATRVHPEADLVAGSALATIALHPADADGRWRLVPAGAVAEVVVGLDGSDFVAVRSAPPGDGPRNHGSAPLADRSARDASRTVIAGPAEFEAALDSWRVLTAATLVGIGATAIDLAVTYALEREQFGVPIGSFQAVQHALADLPGLVDGARLLTHKAAWVTDRGEPGSLDVDHNDITDPAALATMAFVFAADAAAAATDRSLHVHGGYGFAEEYDIQLFYRRARGWALVLDDPARECLQLADRLFPTTAGR